MMKILCPVNMQVFSLGIKRIRCTNQGNWLLPLVDYNGMLKAVVVPDTILSTEARIMLPSPQHMA